jgi:hypothetical protein
VFTKAQAPPDLTLRTRSMLTCYVVTLKSSNHNYAFFTKWKKRSRKWKPRLSTRPSIRFSFHVSILSLLVRLSVAWHQRLECWLDFHEIRYKSSLQKHGATVSHTPLKDINESLPALSIFIPRFSWAQLGTENVRVPQQSNYFAQIGTIKVPFYAQI